MNKKYSSGNYLINSNFDTIKYELNVNETNNKLVYFSNLFPYAKTNYLSFSFLFLNNTIDLPKLSIYYTFELINGMYKIYDSKGDFETATFYEDEEDYTLYKSDSYELYYCFGDQDYDYDLFNLKTNTHYYFYNSNYPKRILYYDTRTAYLTISNNNITRIECNNEIITFTYSSNSITAYLIKTYNNQEFMVSKTIISKLNQDNIQISYYIYEYDSDDEDYLSNLVNTLDISYSSNVLTINKNIDNTETRFYYTNNLITKIEYDTGNVLTKNISYQTNITTITENENSIHLFYDTENMLMYSVKNSKYIKYLKYNNKKLVEYKSEYLKNNSIIEDDLLDYDIETYEPEDEYDDFDYSFSINQVYNQTIPSILTNFINSNDIYYIDGYGELSYNLNIYGEEDDDTSLLLFTKLITGYVYVTISYYGGDYSHTSITKQISTISTEFIPFVVGLKPGYSYDKIRIELFVNGQVYMNTPKLSKTHMGNYYSYDSHNNLISISNNEGITNYTYNSYRLITSIQTPKMTRTFTRDGRGNVLQENIDGFIFTRTYDNKNRILTESSPDSSVNYQYSEEVINNEYRSIITTTKPNINQVEDKYDNLNRKIVSKETYTIDNNQETDMYSYGYEGIKNKQISHNLDQTSYNYNYYGKLIHANNGLNTMYEFNWSNNNITDVKYNISKYVDKKTYDNRNRVITDEFNGIYNYNYSINPKKIDIYLNNTLKGTLSFNNYDYLISDGYNNLEYYNNDSIKKNTILNYEFNYYKNSINYKKTNDILFNHFYNNHKYGDNKLKYDSYYANITYNNDPEIYTINSSNITLMKYEDKFYPLSANLLSTTGDSPKYFLKQEYKLFYYDKDINNYATLLYGTKIRYETNILYNGQIELEFKLENRNIDQLIILFKSLGREVYLCRNSSQKLILHNAYTNNTQYTNYQIDSDVWYNISVGIHNNYIHVKIKKLSDNSYNNYYYYNYSYNQNECLMIQLGKIEYYYNPMTTYGLIRNLFVTNSLDNDRDYLNIYKTNSLKLNNEIKNSEIRINRDVIFTINKEIEEVSTFPYNYPSCYYEKRKISIGNYSLESTLYRNKCYRNKIYLGSNSNNNYTYYYDNKNRLSKENVSNPQHETYRYEYSYDGNDNITCIKRIGTNAKQINLSYDNQYKMILNTVQIIDNQTITYQVTYDNVTGMLPISFMGNTYSYEGIRLISYNNYNYEYNLYGKRIRKYNNDYSADIRYYYDKDNKLILEDRGTYKLRYLYDSSNDLYGFIYEILNNNSYNYYPYFYIKDELGVIHGIIDCNGNIKGRYYYNAYGLIIDMDSSNIMNINPIRYKSYYYDIESDMYYLNSRYYNPMIARFITPDRFENVDLKNKQEYNLYSYCLNDPVNNEDPEGTFSWKNLLKAAVVANFGIIGLALVGAEAAVDATKRDLNNLSNLEARPNGNVVTINDSYRIVTPWVQFGYSFYLNYINKETKDIIKGSSVGVQFEWLCHNLAYYAGFEKEKASSVSVGKTIFSDDHDFFTIAMLAAYFNFFPFLSSYDSKIDKG